MEESIYSKLPKVKIEINLVSLIASFIGITISFVIPIYLINQSTISNIKTTTGQVAGISTEKQEPSTLLIPFINQKVVLEGQSGTLALLGIALMGICIIILLYLIIDSLRKNSKY